MNAIAAALAPFATNFGARSIPSAVTRYARRNGLDLPAGYSRNGSAALKRPQAGSEWRTTQGDPLVG